LGGTPILPHLPFLEELNPGLREGRFEWKEIVVPKGTVYDDILKLEHGRFWPLFLAKTPPLTPLPVGYTFKGDEEVVGIFRSDTAPSPSA